MKKLARIFTVIIFMLCVMTLNVSCIGNSDPEPAESEDIPDSEDTASTADTVNSDANSNDIVESLLSDGDYGDKTRESIQLLSDSYEEYMSQTASDPDKPSLCLQKNT